MNNSADSTPPWKVWLGAMAENNGWRSSSGWTPIRSPAARCCAGGCVGPEGAARPWKKNARNPEPVAFLAAGRHGGRSDGPPRLVDRQTLASDQPRTGPVGGASLPEHRPPSAGGTGLRPARRSQESLFQQSPPQSTVRLSDLSAAAVWPEGLSHYQRE